jgi:hypothetical protein
MRNILYLVCVSFLIASCADGGSFHSDNTSTGKGGSMARFAIRGDMLYTVSTDSMKFFNIEQAENPIHTPERDIQVGFEIETVFPMDTLLFIGSRNGMYVYDITMPQFPTLISQVSHLRSCDPVVAQGNYAFVTLNTNASNCGPNPNNMLHVYDISNPASPVLTNSRSLTGPTGLGIDGTKLFVCDRGLKVFDISNPLNIRQIDDLYDIDQVNIRSSYDVIPVNGLLILVAEEGLFQFDYTGDRLRFVSKIEIKQPTP